MSVYVTCGEREWLCRTTEELARILAFVMKAPQTEQFTVTTESGTKWTVKKEVDS